MTKHVCPCCGGESTEAFQMTVLERHEAVYASCTCGSLHVVNPHWLGEAYADPTVADALDGGAPSRAAALCSLLLSVPQRGRWLDYGCGRGLLVDALRGRGRSMDGFDPFRNVPMPPHEQRSFALVGSFEVLEHQVDPAAFLSALRDLIADDGVLLVSTWLRDPLLHQASWSYLAAAAGQHVVFPSRNGMFALTERVGLHWSGTAWSHALEGLEVHVLSRDHLGPLRADGWGYIDSRNFNTPSF